MHMDILLRLRNRRIPTVLVNSEQIGFDVLFSWRPLPLPLTQEQHSYLFRNTFSPSL